MFAEKIIDNLISYYDLMLINVMQFQRQFKQSNFSSNVYFYHMLFAFYLLFYKPIFSPVFHFYTP